MLVLEEHLERVQILDVRGRTLEVNEPVLLLFIDVDHLDGQDVRLFCDFGALIGVQLKRHNPIHEVVTDPETRKLIIENG